VSETGLSVPARRPKFAPPGPLSHIPRMRASLALIALLASACGGGLMDEPVQNAASAPEVMDPVTNRPSPPPGALYRQDVNATVEEGLGYFLQRVSVDPELVGGKFRGFRIVALQPVEWWQGVDLRPGDVVTQVNGMSIERDIDAYTAFQALRTAPQLRVTFVRGGAKHELVYSIIDHDGSVKGAVPKPKSAPPAPVETPNAPAAPRSG
jgi:hypothetical protein